MFDLQVKRTKETLVQVLNDSRLPVSMLACILQELQIATQRELISAIAQQEKIEQEEAQKSNTEEK